MMLMSLVENAIKHGVEPKPGGGRIAIERATDGNALRVTRAPTTAWVSGDAGGGSGIGLRNIRETLASLFGARAQLDRRAESGAGGGVVATIEVPLRAGAARMPAGRRPPSILHRPHDAGQRHNRNRHPADRMMPDR